MFKNMTLDELKTELEKRTEFRFEKTTYWLDEALYLKGTKTNTKIVLFLFGKFNGIKGRRLGICGQDNRNDSEDFNGVSFIRNNINDAIDCLNVIAYEYGWKPSNE